MKYAELQAMTDEEVIALHDARAENTVYGVQWFMDELTRRKQDEATNALVRLTNVLTWVTVLIAACTVASTIASIYAVTR